MKGIVDGPRARPRVLYVVYNVPHVPAPGAFTRAFHLVNATARVGRVTLVGLVEPDLPAQPEHLEALAPLCDELLTVPALPAPSPPPLVRALTQPLRRAFRRLSRHPAIPSIWWRFDARPLCALVARLLARGGYDLVIVEHAEIAAALRPIVAAWGGPCLADLHNVISVHQARTEQSARMQPSFATRPSRAIRRIRAEERAIIRAYSRVSVCSLADAAELGRIAVDARVSVVPNGVDVAYFERVAESVGEPDHLIFTGALWYAPNVDGLQFFLDAVWPLVRARRPWARLSIVGARPTPAVAAMARHPGVAVYGSVPDVRPYLARAGIAIVPLRLGSGTRLKILEALAAHRPVVSTTLGAEGLELVHERDLLIADRPEAFATAICRLMEHPEQAQPIAARGHDSVCERYDWSVIGRAYGALVRDLLRSGRYTEPRSQPSARPARAAGAERPIPNARAG